MTDKTGKIDIYQTVTDAIVAALEAGAGAWRMPWHTSGKFAFSPRNVVSKKAYRGINTLVLWAAAEKKGYTSGDWATYKQWTEKGAQVRKGEKATSVVFWKFSNGARESQDGDGAEPGEIKLTRSHLVCVRGYAVFNAAQVDGYTPEVEPTETEETKLERIAHAEEFFKLIGADVRAGGNRAFYTPGGDYIQLPPFEAFKGAELFYSTEAHEHIHWTGSAARCDRDLTGRFGQESYAMEELVAELGAAFTCANLGIENNELRQDHAAYLASWLKVLKADKRAVFTAASKAQAAADYLLARAEKSSESEAA